MTTSNPPKLTEEQAKAAISGITMGRTLQELEQQGNIPVEALLEAIRTNEQLALDFKIAREFSSYVIEDEITTRLKANALAPEGANKTNALKAWADHAHKQLDARNPAIFSGKAALTTTVPIQIITSLDLNVVKRIDDVYNLEATVVEERDVITIPDDQLANAIPILPGALENTPFDRAVAAANEQEAIEAAAARLDAIPFGPEPDQSLGESQQAPRNRANGRPMQTLPRSKRGSKSKKSRPRPRGDEEAA